MLRALSLALLGPFYVLLAAIRAITGHSAARTSTKERP
jgi:hypothetical protein